MTACPTEYAVHTYSVQVLSLECSFDESRRPRNASQEWQSTRPPFASWRNRPSASVCLWSAYPAGAPPSWAEELSWAGHMNSPPTTVAVQNWAAPAACHGPCVLIHIY